MACDVGVKVAVRVSTGDAVVGDVVSIVAFVAAEKVGVGVGALVALGGAPGILGVATVAVVIGVVVTG